MSGRLWFLLFVQVLVGPSDSRLGTCTLDEVVQDVAVTVVSEAASLLLTGKETGLSGLKKRPPSDCADIQRQGSNKSGVYVVWPSGGDGYGLEVYCDFEQDGGGWTVIQRRGDFGSGQNFFYKRWREYKFGFGNISQDFWLGNDRICQLTNQNIYSLRVVLTNGNGETRYAQYEEFFIEPEDQNYTLHVRGYSGNAGDSLSDTHSGQMFSTWDRDNDASQRNCALLFSGAWWYEDCYHSNLNGLYMKAQATLPKSISWRFWKGEENFYYQDVVMKIRPEEFP